MVSVRTIRHVFIIGSVVVAGCSTTAREVVVSIRHPANPAAAEAPLPADSTTLAVGPATEIVAKPDAASEHAGHGAAPDHMAAPTPEGR